MGIFLQYAWLIPLFPLLSFAIITLTPIRMSKSASGCRNRFARANFLSSSARGRI